MNGIGFTTGPTQSYRPGGFSCHRWIEGRAGRVCGGYDYSMEVIDELLTGGPFGERWNGGAVELDLWG